MAFGLIQIEGVIAEDPRLLLPYVAGNRRAVGSRARTAGFPYCRGNSVRAGEAHAQKSEAVAGHLEQSVGLTVLGVAVGGLRKIADTHIATRHLDLRRCLLKIEGTFGD